MAAGTLAGRLPQQLGGLRDEPLDGRAQPLNGSRPDGGCRSGRDRRGAHGPSVLGGMQAGSASELPERLPSVQPARNHEKVDGGAALPAGVTFPSAVAVLAVVEAHAGVLVGVVGVRAVPSGAAAPADRRAADLAGKLGQVDAREHFSAVDECHMAPPPSAVWSYWVVPTGRPLAEGRDRGRPSWAGLVRPAADRRGPAACRAAVISGRWGRGGGRRWRCAGGRLSGAGGG